MKRFNFKKLIPIFVILLMAGAFLLYRSGIFNSNQSNLPAETEVQDVEEEIHPLKALWLANHEINSDYIGDLVFDSGLIDVSFVQAKSCYKPNGDLYHFYTEDGRVVTNPEGYNGNDVYIWTYWKTGEYDYNDNGGSVFMDYRNDIDDQNLIIYGHHFSVWNDESRTKAFTPLEKLLYEENYKENSTLKLILEDEVRSYELVAVYNFDATDDDFLENVQYWRVEYNYDDHNDNAYDADYYKNYIIKIKEYQLYDTGVSLRTSDNTLTLQTCISGYTGVLYEIVVFKLTGIEKYNP